ncbi:Protein disulfide-isomerase [Aphelenchoides fujianensis]|nr:Protein disulfide-isomerase [Aphelenchoides fujianensis]
MAELPDTGGSYSFPDDGTGFFNRILFWRTEGSRIHFNEISATRDVNELSLSLDLRPSMIIPGTSVTYHRNILILVIPTSSALHRLSIRVGGEGDQKASNRSVLSYFPRDEDFASFYDHYFLANGVTARRVAINCDFRGDTVALVANNKGQLSVIRMPFFYSTGQSGSETFLREDSMISRFFVKPTEPALAVNMSAFEKQMFAFSVQSDGKLRAWSVQDAHFKAHYGLVEGLRSDAAFDVEDVQVKTFSAGERHVVFVMMQLLKKVRFLFLSFNDDQFDFLTSCDLSHTAVVDFACVPPTATLNFVTLWAITRESYEENERSDAMFQPYLMRRCTVDLRGLESSSWDAVDPGMPDPVFDKLLFADLAAKSIKQRIFDGDTYSFEIVQRAVQTVCKCPTIPVNYRDWPALSNFTEGFVQSGQFKQMYLMDTDWKLMLSASNVDQALLCAAYDRFWSDVQKCCNQFQETLLAPVAIWHSLSLGLVGTIQQSRFTIYVPPDQEMRAMVTANSELVDPLVEVVRDYVDHDFKTDSVKLQSLIKMDVDVVCKIIKRFAESHMQHSEIKLERLKSSYLNSAFSTALLSTALRYRVLGRLCFAKIISMLIKLVPAAFAKANRTVDQRFNAVVNSHLAGILATIKHYNTLWLTLSTTFLNLGQGGRAPKLNTIAQAFFTNGMVSISQAADFIDDDLDDQEPSGGKTIALCEFDGFVNRALDCAMVALWPESKSMVIPRFLAESKYYEALKDYCKQNEPFTTDLSAAFHFFQGIALVRVGLPAAAASFFEEASHEIVAGDEPLNGVLYHYTKQEPPYQHTLTDFYCVVMTIYKLHNQAEYVIRTGIFALSFAAEDDPLRPTIYTSLFTQYVATEQFLEAIRVLHLNPSPTSQKNCLRNLIANLCDKSKTKALVTLHYGKLTEQVAELLETKCTTMPPMSDSGFFETVYAFYIHWYNYEAAARVMYNLCWRLRWEPQSREVLEKRERVLACVTQTVELLPPNHAIEFDLRGLCANADRGLDNAQAERQKLIRDSNNQFKKLRESRKKVFQTPNLKWAVVFVLAFLSAGVGASDVVSLTESVWDSKIADHDIALVEFFAPWCEPCKRLAPEYEKAATKLKSNDPPIALINVDCDAEKDLCQKHGVGGYPTLKIFRKGEFSADYHGPFGADGIVKFMRVQAGPSVKKLETVEDLEKFVNRDESAVVGFFESESKLKDSFLKVADTERDRFRFGYTTNEEVLKKAGYTDDIVVYVPRLFHNIFDPKEYKYDGNYDTEEIKNFLIHETNGLAGIRTPSNEWQEVATKDQLVEVDRKLTALQEGTKNIFGVIELVQKTWKWFVPARPMAPIKLLAQQEATNIYKELFSTYGFSVEQLMELAGLSCAQAVYSAYKKDAIVASRHLKLFGFQPTILYPKKSKNELMGRLVTQATKMDIEIVEELPADLGSRFDVILDGIFGFSFKPPLRVPFGEILERVANSGVPIVSIDIPSGWDVENGPIDGIVNLAPETLISLTAPKKCARHFTGRNHFLGGRFVPDELAEKYQLNLPENHQSHSTRYRFITSIIYAIFAIFALTAAIVLAVLVFKA